MADFVTQFKAYKRAIDEDIERYAAHIHTSTEKNFGHYPGVVSDAFLDLLTRGGKRIRGTLVMTGYEMCGGKDRAMILRAATALEMLHAGLLTIDDIQDHSDTRRGKPTVHVALGRYAQKQQWPGQAEYTGISLALDAALAGIHACHLLLSGLEVDPQLKVNTMAIVNQTVITTVHGQTYDIVNVLTDNPKAEDIDRAREWKSAHYTFLNPLCVGMVLAGAGCEHTDAIRDYALHTGMAFQLVDDIMDGDIKGSEVAKTKTKAEEHVKQAQASLKQVKLDWTPANVQFLHDLADFVISQEK